MGTHRGPCRGGNLSSWGHRGMPGGSEALGDTRVSPGALRDTGASLGALRGHRSIPGEHRGILLTGEGWVLVLCCRKL